MGRGTVRWCVSNEARASWFRAHLIGGSAPLKAGHCAPPSWCRGDVKRSWFPNSRSNRCEERAQRDRRVRSRFSALVTDINPGRGISDWEVAREARHLRPTITVVCLSGASQADWGAEGVPKSIMIPKLFTQAQLVMALTTLMNDVPGSTGI